jgi:hypothetical protein
MNIILTPYNNISGSVDNTDLQADLISFSTNALETFFLHSSSIHIRRLGYRPADAFDPDAFAGGIHDPAD